MPSERDADFDKAIEELRIAAEERAEDSRLEEKRRANPLRCPECCCKLEVVKDSSSIHGCEIRRIEIPESVMEKKLEAAIYRLTSISELYNESPKNLARWARQTLDHIIALDDNPNHREGVD